MNATLTRLVRRRAKGCCEYGMMPQDLDPTPFENDHIIADEHKGLTVAANRCDR